ncbi:iron dependent repressor, metal binding and dimerization domain protein [Archaeoglobus fulgidus]|uniref:iron dependent repressor, metal binding and dimerization domain protein n=1 Tax=Archaeoglobus fulgidus TaxID=2234 RepID=UPI001FCACF80|nr:iron dependent repressor, metal binding and dimerization domain protein [Archaeoglobus fulgidus]
MVRLHRLAERLLSDILGFKDVEEHACRFEHLIDDEAEEAICTLLGHPQVCPHGRTIPAGNCCIIKETEVERVIYRLSELSQGDERYRHSRKALRPIHTRHDGKGDGRRRHHILCYQGCNSC